MKKSIFLSFLALAAVAIACSCASCKNTSKSGAASEPDTVALVGPTFSQDSAYAFAAKQCSFGERTMNSKAHDLCGDWIMAKFREFGMKVEAQDAELTGWDVSVRSRPRAFCSAPIGTAVHGPTTTPTQPTGTVR